MLIALVLLAATTAWLLRVASGATDPNQGPGGPILVVTSPSSSFGKYYAEILRTEGLNAFEVADISAVTSAKLAEHDVVILAAMPLTAGQVSTLTAWVTGGGNLIAMRPDSQLAGLLGLAAAGTTPLSDGYLRVAGTTRPGAGIVQQTIQFHGSADRYTLDGATSLATLYSDATTATPHPAVSLRVVGTGQAAAFAYDLATSVVYTRQGNPAWAAQERDGYAPVRSDDKFFGNAAGDPRPDWVDPQKIAIPQADEQQRLLANLVTDMNRARKPLPRYWYFPQGKRAVVIMTGDDHANGGTAARFDQFKALGPAGCSVADWECVRGTSYIYTSGPMTDAQAAAYTADGFEVSLHVNNYCSNYTFASLDGEYASQVASFRGKYTSIPAPLTERHHCLVWSDWVSGAQVQSKHGIRMDTTYYYWPPSWINNVPGLFTGSAMPMRFAALDGTIVDVYKAATQMTDESGQQYPLTVDTLLDRAVGPEGYYGAYTVNAHTDVATSEVADAVIASARARGVPIVSARQMLNWLDARNASSFSSLAWSANTLTFSVVPDPAARGLQAMLPMRTATGVLNGLTRAGTAVPFTTSTIKGIEYAFFAAAAGSYVATYGADGSAPTVSSTSPAAGATGVATAAAVTATFSKDMDAATITTGTFELRDAGGALIPASVSYVSATRTASLRPTAALAEGGTYTATVRGGSTDPRVKDTSGNALAASVSWSFTVVSGPACPCGGWGASATPTNPSSTDTGAIEVGVKFTSDVAGWVTGVRFYKGSGNTGTHVGNLWSASGQLLARATFANETASGWQQVAFDTPVQIQANTVYVASYFAPNGQYASDNGYFATRGVDNPPIRLLRDGVAGGNGVYAYGSASSFPSSSWQSTNYWVDVVFATTRPADTTPPTVGSVTPAAGATGVAAGTAVKAAFSEPVDPATVAAATFELRDAASAPVPAAVAYDAATRTATLTPSSPLAASTTYTATVRGGTADPRIKDAAGNALAASVTWSFTTAAPPGACPCGGWGDSTVPGTAASTDTGAVELGVKFTSDVAGWVTGVRFYKGSGNTGTHVGNLWSASGQLLARATFQNETASGWQQVLFATPVQIQANTVYVASYFAPVGRYALDAGYFATRGVDNPPIRLLRDGVAGGNGVYAYGASTRFPGSSYQSSNYWVDVVFVTSRPADTGAPTVSSVTPASGATGVATGTAVSAAFSEALDPATVSGSTFELRDAGGATVAGTLSYDAPTSTATLTPSAPLAAGATYTATVRGGTADPRIKDAVGNALATSSTWSFTTAAPRTCPCSLWGPTAVPSVLTDSETQGVEVGVKFTSDVAGRITGIRFYKGSTNTGTHVGNLWSASGQLLARATFQNETASGWQQVLFATPVAIQPNTVYVASYYAPRGRYSTDARFFATQGLDNPPLRALRDGASGGNGVYAYGASTRFPGSTWLGTNYWVDVVFESSGP